MLRSAARLGARVRSAVRVRATGAGSPARVAAVGRPYHVAGVGRPLRVARVGRPLRTARVGSRVRVACLALAAVSLAAGCGATPSAAPSGPATGSAPASSIPTPAPTVPGTPPSSGASATPRSSGAAPTPAAFWAAATRGIAAAKHLQVTLAGPNPGLLRYEATASAAIVDGKIGFVCAGGAAYDGQSRFARVPGRWECGAAALVRGFRRIGQPADSWSAGSPSDASIKETVTLGTDGTWTWAYSGISPFLGGRVTARVTLDPVRGRLLAARRTDPTGSTTYTFDYAVTFPVIAVPKP